MPLSAVITAALKFFTALLDLWHQGQLDQQKADNAVDAAIASLKPVGDPS